MAIIPDQGILEKLLSRGSDTVSGNTFIHRDVGKPDRYTDRSSMLRHQEDES